VEWNGVEWSVVESSEVKWCEEVRVEKRIIKSIGVVARKEAAVDRFKAPPVSSRMKRYGAAERPEL
jgi:hypothetical protein